METRVSITERLLARIFEVAAFTRALADIEAFMVDNESLPIGRRVNSYLASLDRDRSLMDKEAQNRSRDSYRETPPPFDPSGSKYKCFFFYFLYLVARSFFLEY